MNMDSTTTNQVTEQQEVQKAGNNSWASNNPDTQADDVTPQKKEAEVEPEVLQQASPVKEAFSDFEQAEYDHEKRSSSPVASIAEAPKVVKEEEPEVKTEQIE